MTAPAPDVLSIADVMARTGLCRQTIYNEIERGNMPRPVQLTPNRVAFRVADYEAWLASRPAGEMRLEG